MSSDDLYIDHKGSGFGLRALNGAQSRYGRYFSAKTAKLSRIRMAVFTHGLSPCSPDRGRLHA